MSTEMDAVKAIARGMVERSGIGHLSIHRFVDHGEYDRQAPRNEGELRVVLLGWSPSLHPMRIPVLIPRNPSWSNRHDGHDYRQLEAAIRSQRRRWKTAAALRGRDPWPADRTFDVSIQQARPDASDVLVDPQLVDYLVGLMKSPEDARRHIEMGVETIIRRREEGNHKRDERIALVDSTYYESIVVHPGVFLSYGWLYVSRDAVPCTSDMVGEYLAQTYDVPGLGDRIIERIVPNKDGWTIVLKGDKKPVPLHERIGRDPRGNERLQDRVPEMPHVPEVGVRDPIPEAGTTRSMPDWTVPDRRIAGAMHKAGITTVEQVAMMDDQELYASTGLDQHGVMRLRAYATSRLNEMLAMNAGRLVRRA